MTTTMKTLLIMPADAAGVLMSADSQTAYADVTVEYDRLVEVDGKTIPRLAQTIAGADGTFRASVYANDDPAITTGAGFAIRVTISAQPRNGIHGRSVGTVTRTISIGAKDADTVRLADRPDLIEVPPEMRYDAAQAMAQANDTAAAAGTAVSAAQKAASDASTAQAQAQQAADQVKTLFVSNQAVTDASARLDAMRTDLDANTATVTAVNTALNTPGGIKGTSIQDASISTDALMANSITGDKIAANTIDGGKIVANSITGAQIAAESVAATLGDFIQVHAENILAGVIQATVGIGTSGKIVAGNAAGWTQIDSDGLTIHAQADDGTDTVLTQLSAKAANVISLANSDGVITTTGTPAGDWSMNTLGTNGDITIAGRPLLGRRLDPKSAPGILEDGPAGVRGFGDFRSLVSGGKVNNTSASLGILTVPVEPGRVYELSMPFAYYVGDVASSSTDLNCRITAYYSADSGTPADPTTDSTVLALATKDYAKSYTTPVSERLTAEFISPATAPGSTMKILLVAKATNCSMGFSVSDLGQWRAWVKDIGAAVPSTARVAASLSTQTTTVTGSAPVTQDQVTPKQTFTSTWVGTASQNYWGSGAKATNYSPANSGYLAQGYYDSSTGNMRSAVVFGGTAVSGEQKTMSDALAGATIQSVSISVKGQHSYYSTGMNVALHPLGGTSLPDTLTSIPSANATKQLTTRIQAATITVGNDWFSPTSTGFILGPGPAGNSQNDYGYICGLANQADADKPQVTITYTR